jgi:hypothetical protein
MANNNKLSKPGLIPLKVENQGSLITTQVNKINFTGSGVTASVGQFNDLTILITGGGGSGVSSSYALTSSFAATASYFSGSITNAISSSYALTASYVANASSFPYTGSAQITGSLGVTGSIGFSGSIIQVGNILMSGSIIISGSTTPGNPTASMQIYGDIRQTGYHRFDPVTTNIVQATSASYIYVSGSTNDLYFAQNSAGYSNTTRLRWIEGNMYTGLLSGGVLSSTPGSTTFNLSSGSGIIVTLNATTASADPYPTIQYIGWGNFISQSITNISSAKITYISVNSAGTINQSITPVGYSDPTQWDNQIEIGVVLHLSGNVSTGVYNTPQVAYGQSQRTDDFIRAFGPVKISGHILQTSGSTLGLTKTAGVAYNNGANYVINPNHPSTVTDVAVNISKIYRYYISGSTPVIDTGVANAGYTGIDNTKYVVSSSGALASVPGGRFTIQRVFWIPNSPTNAFLVYYGNDTYNSADTAVTAIQTEPFSEAPNTAQNAILVGYVIVNGGDSNLNNATIIQGGLFRSINGVGASGTSPTTNTLAGLSDVSVATKATGDLFFFSGSLWYNTKQLSGSYGITGSLNTTGSIIATFITASSLTGSFTGSLFGSLLGTSSWSVSASQAITSSFALNAISASYALSSSFAITSSYARTASYVNPLTQSLLVSGSAIITGSTNITGAVDIKGDLNVSSTIITLNAPSVALPGLAFPYTPLSTVKTVLFDTLNNVLFVTSSLPGGGGGNATYISTGSVTASVNVTDLFIIQSSSRELLKFNNQGVMVMEAYYTTPTAITGGFMYSASGDFFVGL